jgi:integration host factor subunit beta
MKYKNIVNKVIEKEQFDPEKVEEIIRLALDGIANIILTEGRIELSNFGEFKIVTVKARKVHNPETGEIFIKPERQTVRFKPSKIMKEKFNQGE